MVMQQPDTLGLILIMNSINPIVIKVGGSFFDSLEEADSGQILFRAIKQLQSKTAPGYSCAWWWRPGKTAVRQPRL